MSRTCRPHPWILLATLGLGACDGHHRTPTPDGDAGHSDPLDLSNANLPQRRYYLANEGVRCVFFWSENGTDTNPTVVRCPRGLEPGERFRLAGKTCIREQSSPERNVPVRCPKTLLRAPDIYRDAGAPD